LFSDILIAVFSGALTGLALPRPGLCFLAWLSLAPLFFLWRKSADWRHAALIGLAAGFGYHGTVLYWIFSTCRFAGLSVLVGVMAWSSLALVLALNWAVIGALGRRFAEPRSYKLWAWAAIWIAVTFVSERWTPRLCADLLAYTQWRHISLLQVSSLAGPHFLGFLLLAANAAIEGVWSDRNKAATRSLAAVLGAILLCGIYGAYSLSRRPSGNGRSERRVALLQPAIDQYQKFESGNALKIKSNFDELLARDTVRPDLVVWPETSLPGLAVVGETIPVVAAWGPKLRAWQIVGAVSQDGQMLRNSALLFSPEGAMRAVYHKRQLVPFGEFVPLKFLDRFIGILRQMGGLTPGAPRQDLFDTPLGPAAAGICYEAVFPELLRRDVARGARLAVNLTNDGWYKDTWGPYQHFWVNAFRAVENRVTVVRCGNTGISGVIDPWGVVTAATKLNVRDRLDASVPVDDPFPRRSFYARHGDWFGWLSLLGAGILLATGFRRS
jgi:apolipoprotein N-acyltransferase